MCEEHTAAVGGNESEHENGMGERTLPNQTEHAPGSCRGDEADGKNAAREESSTDVVQGVPYEPAYRQRATYAGGTL